MLETAGKGDNLVFYHMYCRKSMPITIQPLGIHSLTLVALHPPPSLNPYH